MAFWINLHVEFDRKVSKGKLTHLNSIMSDRDYDWVERDVYSDGIRMRARSPLYKLDYLLNVFRKLNINGKLYFLPTGSNCKMSAEEHEHMFMDADECVLHSVYACDARPNKNDWVTF